MSRRPAAVSRSMVSTAVSHAAGCLQPIACTPLYPTCTHTLAVESLMAILPLSGLLRSVNSGMQLWGLVSGV